MGLRGAAQAPEGRASKPSQRPWSMLQAQAGPSEQQSAWPEGHLMRLAACGWEAGQSRWSPRAAGKLLWSQNPAA